MTLKIPARTRTIVYVIAFAVALLTAAVLGILGIGGHGLAVANRPTKTTAGESNA